MKNNQDDSLQSTSEWTTSFSSSIDDILNSLQYGGATNAVENKAASPESEWFANLNEKE